MDDVDSVQAVIARNMLTSGDWVSATLDGVKYLEKAAGWYWMIAASFRLFGVYDWVARIPIILSAVLLCLLIARIGKWGANREIGRYSGVVLATSVGLFLFTRILIPDVCLTLTITLALWSFLRALEPDEVHPRAWANLSAVSIACGILLKGLVGGVFPVGIGLAYLLISGTWRHRQTWKRLHVASAMAIVLGLSAPWHILATIRNPPYFVMTLHSGPGEYKGFAWFYFVNEHLLRFLNLRYPRDYNTVPRAWFWSLHFLWLFPWSVFIPSLIRLNYGFASRVERLRALALIWLGFVLIFFSFSTTQEYYSMPCYPAFALLIAMAMDRRDAWTRWSLRGAAAISLACLTAAGGLLIASWSLPHPGDISRALNQHPSAYTLSLGHMGDLTASSFAYLRTPLLLAALAFFVGTLAGFIKKPPRAFAVLALMMILFVHAARVAMISFDPYLSSRSLAEALDKAPWGKLIFDDQFYTFSSVAFYADRPELLLNGKVNNLEYGSNAADCPKVFISNDDLATLWKSTNRYYLLAEGPRVESLARLVGGRQSLVIVAESGGKFLFCNHAR